MPRGGGGFGGGGGFHGGGFHGGGSRGFSGGFRSSSFSRSSHFRGSSSFSPRSSGGRPFGRTGASRTYSSRSRRGPYSHSYYYPHRYYYGYYYRPWYYRRHWWYGYYYRPWYYAPAYWVSGTIFLIMFLLIFLPLFGIAIAYPFSSGSTGEINYRSTETLYVNEYWYEYEKISSGDSIDFSIQSSPGPISFIIADHPFDEFPVIDQNLQFSFTPVLNYNDFEYYQIFLNPGSQITYQYSSDIPIDFLIMDGNNFYDWYYYNSYSTYDVDVDSLGSSGTLNIPDGYQDYYIVVYNSHEGSVANVNVFLNIFMADVPDFSSALYYEYGVTSISQHNIVVPTSGTWYFFVYADPLFNADEYVDITFDVTYDTSSNPVSVEEQWANARPTLIWILIIAGGFLTITIIARRKQKANKDKLKKPGTAASTLSSTLSTKTSNETSGTSIDLNAKSSIIKCSQCGTKMEPDAVYCPNCGKKKEGRSLGVPIKTTPGNRTYCNYCGAKLPKSGKFCESCGTPIQGR
ncbi:zinc ribbon domain-containing protein [Candidatus Harpocratesius sp.]